MLECFGIKIIGLKFCDYVKKFHIKTSFQKSCLFVISDKLCFVKINKCFYLKYFLSIFTNFVLLIEKIFL